MNKSFYLNDDNWSGSYYELCLELGDWGINKNVEKALWALWNCEELSGPWKHRDDVNSNELKITHESDYTILYGVADIAHRKEIGVCSYIIRVEGESDWLDFSIPLGMLEQCYSVTYPLQYRTNLWLEDIDLFLAYLGVEIYRNFPFRLGMIGEEVSGYFTAAELSKAECERGGFLIPHELWHKLGTDCPHQRLSPDLFYIPYSGTHIEFFG